jgi:hypothetical protein
MPLPAKARPGSKKTAKPGHLNGNGHCLRMLGVLSDYLDRREKIRLCRRVEEHLKECPECRMYVDTLKKTVVLYRSLGDEKVPGPVQKRLFKTIRLAEIKSEENDLNGGRSLRKKK